MTYIVNWVRHPFMPQEFAKEFMSWDEAWEFMVETKTRLGPMARVELRKEAGQ